MTYVKEVVKTASLHLQAYHIIKNAIMEGAYQPSERLVEAKAASKLGVSRGTVREAFRMLIQDGLLTYNDGFVRVYQPSVKDVMDIFQCRESLETLAIRLAIKNISTSELEQLATNLKDTREAMNDGRAIELGQLDQQFHTIIIQASGNSHLIELLEVIKTKIHYMRNSMVKGDFYPSFVEEHEQIYEILLEGNEMRAVERMKQHIEKALEGVLLHIDLN